VLYEVSNTFGQWHHHLFAAGELDAAGNVRHVFDRELSVSPFIGMDAAYEFRVRPPGERVAVVVREREAGGHVLTATLTARRSALTTSSLWGVFVRHPMVTLKVVGGIHREALTLWRKRVPWHRHGPAPARDVSIGGVRAAPPTSPPPGRSWRHPGTGSIRRWPPRGRRTRTEGSGSPPFR
jgi:DUF1365 family protein